jgi:phage replication-related protein YjqB (UPF0714/DUF867 family)
MFDELLRHPGVEEDVALRSSFGFLAFHGGSLEEMTDTIAAEAADRAGASLYAVRQPPELHWHIPSAMVDPAHSPALASFLDHVDVAVAVHGYGRAGLWTTLLLGGRNRELAAHVREHLAEALPDYTMLDRVEAIPTGLRGLHPDNPVNRPSFAGVQLELPPRVRGMGPVWAEWEGPGLVPHTEALIGGLAAAAEAWPAA